MSADPKVCGFCGDPSITFVPMRTDPDKSIALCDQCRQDVENLNIDSLTNRWVYMDDLYKEIEPEFKATREEIWEAARDAVERVLSGTVPNGYVVPADFRTLPADGKLRRVILG